MNWASMARREVRSYAPLHATTDLERALITLVEADAVADDEAAEARRQAGYAWEAQADAERKLERLKDELFAILNDEDGDNAHLLKRVREVLDNA